MRPRRDFLVARQAKVPGAHSQEIRFVCRVRIMTGRAGTCRRRGMKVLLGVPAVFMAICAKLGNGRGNGQFRVSGFPVMAHEAGPYGRRTVDEFIAAQHLFMAHIAWRLVGTLLPLPGLTEIELVAGGTLFFIPAGMKEIFFEPVGSVVGRR